MVEDTGGVSFSVIFFDGERESNIGDVSVYPSLTHKNFLSILSKKIGISPHQFSVYLTRKHSSSSEIARRIPITGKVNFGVIVNEKDCFFLVVLKRRAKKPKGQKGFRDFEYYTPSPNVAAPVKKIPPGNVMLLRRNADVAPHAFPGFMSPILDPAEYERRVMNLQAERERYLINMGLSDLAFPMPENRGDEKAGQGVAAAAACEECRRANETGQDAGFHWCVYDAVTVGFRSPAGPIARPPKNS